MKQFITRIVKFLGLICSALRSSAAHALQRHYRCEDYHHSWVNLIWDWRWIVVPIPAIWEVSGDTDWCLPVTVPGAESQYTTYWAAHCEIFGEATYYYVVETSRGRVPWMMIRDFYRI